VRTAEHGNTAAVALMLDLGFPIETSGGPQMAAAPARDSQKPARRACGLVRRPFTRRRRARPTSMALSQ
jgi:hypothetical protein